MQDMPINWDFMVARWKRIVVGMVGGLAIASMAFALAKPQWEASAMIQIGQMAGPNAASSNGPLLIESADAVEANMTRPSFIRSALQRAGRPDMILSLLPSQYNGEDRLKVRAMSPGILIVTLRASSRELAKQLTESVVAELVEEHSRLGVQHVNGADDALARIQSELERRSKEVALMDKQVLDARAASDNGKNADSALIPWLIGKSLVDEDRNLAALIGTLLVAPEARKTRMIGQVESLDEPVFPAAPNFIALGIVLGVALTASLLWQARAQARAIKKERGG